MKKVGQYFKAFKYLFGSYLFLSVVTVQAKSIEYKWSTGHAMPTAMQEIYPAVFNGKIYVGGGFIAGGEGTFFGLSPSRRVFIFNPDHSAWNETAKLPEARHHLGLVSNTQYLYGIGGFSGKKGKVWQIQDSVYRLAEKEDRWLSGPELPLPLASSVYASVNNNIHIIGGKTRNDIIGKNVDTDKHYILKENEQWVEMASATIKRNSAASAVIGDRIYVIGGRTSGPNFKNLSFAEFYDVERNSWTQISPLPVVLAGLSATALNGKVFVFGGEAFSETGKWQSGKAYNQVWVYSPDKNAWDKVSDMPTPRHGHGSITLDGKVYVIGGAEKVGPQQTLASTIILTEKSD